MLRVVVCTTAAGVQTTTLNTKEGRQEIIPVVEAGLGLTYMTWFSDDNYMFSLKAGWEEQLWLSVDNNLSLHGFTLKVGFAF